jgi:hypothetical protein
MYGHSHATKPGWVTAGISANSGGRFTVNNQGLGTGVDVFYVDINGNMAVDTNTLFVDATNNRVGVGTASPSQAFHINGSAARILIQDTNQGGAGFVAGRAASEVFLGNDGAIALSFLINNTERMRLDPSGNLGIGASTINASAKLQVDSTTQGFLPPRMTSTQRSAISSPSVGLVVYQTDGVEGLYIYTNTNGWKSLAIVN